MVVWRTLLPASEFLRTENLQRNTGRSPVLKFLAARHPELTGEEFEDLLLSLKSYIKNLLKSSTLSDVDRATRCVEDLAVGQKYVGDVIIRTWVQTMEGILLDSEDRSPEVLRTIAAALGRINASGSNRRISQFLGSLVTTTRGMGTMLVLKSLAEHAPASFNVSVIVLLDRIWSGLISYDSKERNLSAEALRACLQMFKTRETREHVQGYHKLTTNALEILTKTRPTLSELHGCVLTLSELLENSGEFLLSWYWKLASSIMDLLAYAMHDAEHASNAVSISVQSLIPKLSNFWPECFNGHLFNTSMKFLLSALNGTDEWELCVDDREKIFEALADTIVVLKNHKQVSMLNSVIPGSYGVIVINCIDDVVSKAIQMTANGEKSPHQGALKCCGILAEALGANWKATAKDLVQPMAQTGLSSELGCTMMKISNSIPELYAEIQETLQIVIQAALGNPDSQESLSSENNSPGGLPISVNEGLDDPSTIMGALEALCNFNFSGVVLKDMTEFALKKVVNLLRTDSNPSIRMLAARVCAQLASHYTKHTDGTENGHEECIEKIVDRLVEAGVTDIDDEVRVSTLKLLRDETSLEHCLSKCMYQLFMGFGDACWQVVRISIQLVGVLGARLGPEQPEWRMLEATLDQLLFQLDICPGNNFSEECAEKLSLIVQYAPYIVLPYRKRIYEQIMRILETEALDNSETQKNINTNPSIVQGNNEVLSAVLETLGCLAETGMSQPEDKEYLKNILKHAMKVLQTKCSEDKMDEALSVLKTIAKIVESTGDVVSPYHDYPWVLPALLEILGMDRVNVRKAVTNVLGTMGALDPASFRVIQAKASGEGRLEQLGVRPIKRGESTLSSSVERSKHHPLGGRALENGIADLIVMSGMSTNSKESYSIIAMHVLLRILGNPAHSAYHIKAVGTLREITTSISVDSVPFLPTLIPSLCEATCNGDIELKVYILEQLIYIVGVAKHHMQIFLDPIMQMLKDLWHESCEKRTLINLLKLIGELAGVCRWKPGSLSWVIHRFLLVLETSTPDVLLVALPALASLGFYLKNQYHQLLPYLSRLLARDRCKGRDDQWIEVQRATLRTIRILVQQLNVADSACALIRPLLKLLENADVRDDVAETLYTVVANFTPDAMILSYVMEVLSKYEIQDRRIKEISSYFNMIETLSSSEWKKGADWRDEPNQTSPTLVKTMPEKQKFQKLELDRTLFNKAWNTSHAHASDDWALWMFNLALSLVEASPSPAIRACYEFAQSIPGVAKDLFPASFISCWTELTGPDQQEFVRSLGVVLGSPNIPHEIITTLLNLSESMEHDNAQMPLDTRTLAALAWKCQAFAKALRYKEIEFRDDPTKSVEAIIAINNQLRQPEAADGMLKYARKKLGMQVKESWYEKLHKWEKALHQFQNRVVQSKPGTPEQVNANMGSIRCTFALWDWENLSKLCQREWGVFDAVTRKEISSMAAEAAWHMGQWDEMSKYLHKPTDTMSQPSTRTAFLTAVHAIHNKDYDHAKNMIDAARGNLSAKIAVLSGESYERAYESLVMGQQLTELEEAIQYSICAQSPGSEGHMEHIRSVWSKRLEGVQKRVEVWQRLLSVHSLVLPHHMEKCAWIKFASMCRRQNRQDHGHATLKLLLQYDPMKKKKGEQGYGSGSGQPDVMYAFLKHMYWVSSLEGKKDVYLRLQDFIIGDLEGDSEECVKNAQIVVGSGCLASKAYVRQGKWMQQLETMTPVTQNSILGLLEKATLTAGKWARAWREWALFHLVLMGQNEGGDHVAPAVRGFFEALKLSQGDALNGGMGGCGPSKDTYQDILRLLTLWFQHGNSDSVFEELRRGFDAVRVETWLIVLPQINARIHIKASYIQQLIHMLLIKIGTEHPQALLYPLLVGLHSTSKERIAATEKILQIMAASSRELVEEARLLTQQLVEIAVLLDEQWHEALEEASRLYFSEKLSKEMLGILIPLHVKLCSEPAKTNSEKNFKLRHGKHLDDAYNNLREFESTHQDTSLEQAWDIYYHVFKSINRDLNCNMNMLHLAEVAPELLDREFIGAVPGTYAPFKEQVLIQRIVPEIQVIKSKQRPRKLTIQGTDGNDYVFLLKGHEDLRQDERVMQLFGLVNTLMANDYKACERELSIARYAVIPLSPNVGLIGWVPNCDTMHQLIRDYRDGKKIPINHELQEMKAFATNHDHLMLVQKIEVFEHVLETTRGDDLREVMWMKSHTSESWLAHRTCYIRSCAVMSIVGYILGLGDRHPSNLMIDRYTGKLLHIDFGDCFESGMNRDKFPEKVPFRLTRMMIKAMEASGIEGTYRRTCELVMRVLRVEKDRVMAMLQAFIYDPLINWRLYRAGGGGNGIGHEEPVTQEQTQAYMPSSHAQQQEYGSIDSVMMLPQGVNEDPADGDVDMGPPALGHSPEPYLGGAHDILNDRAVQVTDRIKCKLSGREFIPDESISVEDQVDRLVIEATSHANLCQAYIGWCPFW